MLGRRSAAAAHHVDEAVAREIGDLLGHLVGRFVIGAHFVRQARVRIGADERLGHAGEFRQVRPHRARAKRTVQPHGEGPGVADGVPEGGRRLARERTPRQVGDRARDHHRQPHTGFRKDFLAGKDRSFGVQRVEDRLDQDQVRAAFRQPPDLLAIGDAQIIEGHGAEARIVHVRADGGGAVRRANGSSHPAGPPVLRRRPVHRTAGDARAFPVQLADQMFHAVIGLRDGGGGEGVRLHDIRARSGVAVVDFLDRLGLGQDQKVIVALLRLFAVHGMAAAAAARTMAVEILFRQAQPLDLRAHRAVEDQDTFPRGGGERVEDGGAERFCGTGHGGPPVKSGQGADRSCYALT